MSGPVVDNSPRPPDYRATGGLDRPDAPRPSSSPGMRRGICRTPTLARNSLGNGRAGHTELMGKIISKLASHAAQRSDVVLGGELRLHSYGLADRSSARNLVEQAGQSTMQLVVDRDQRDSPVILVPL